MNELYAIRYAARYVADGNNNWLTADVVIDGATPDDALETFEAHARRSYADQELPVDIRIIEIKPLKTIETLRVMPTGKPN